MKSTLFKHIPCFHIHFSLYFWKLAQTVKVLYSWFCSLWFQCSWVISEFTDKNFITPPPPKHSILVHLVQSMNQGILKAFKLYYIRKNKLEKNKQIYKWKIENEAGLKLNDQTVEINYHSRLVWITRWRLKWNWKKLLTSF